MRELSPSYPFSRLTYVNLVPVNRDDAGTNSRAPFPRSTPLGGLVGVRDLAETEGPSRGSPTRLPEQGAHPKTQFRACKLVERFPHFWPSIRTLALILTSSGRPRSGLPSAPHRAIHSVRSIERLQTHRSRRTSSPPGIATARQPPPERKPSYRLALRMRADPLAPQQHL